MKNTLSIIFLACTISACGGSGGSSGDDTESTGLQPIESASEAISALQSLGELPKLDRGASLSGTDNDSNGVRDDIDVYISSLSVTSNKKIAIERTAGALQSVQLLDLSAPDALQIVSENLIQSVICISAAFENPADAHKYLKTLEGYTANTQVRTQKYIDFNAARDGSVSRLPSSSNCQ